MWLEFFEFCFEAPPEWLDKGREFILFKPQSVDHGCSMLTIKDQLLLEYIDEDPGYEFFDLLARGVWESQICVYL